MWYLKFSLGDYEKYRLLVLVYRYFIFKFDCSTKTPKEGVDTWRVTINILMCSVVRTVDTLRTDVERQLDRKCRQTEVINSPSIFPSLWVQSQQINVNGTCLIFKDTNGATCKLRHHTSVNSFQPSVLLRLYKYANINGGKVYIRYESLSDAITCMVCCTCLRRHTVMIRDGSVGIVTLCRIENRALDWRKGFFSLPSRLD
jgi:hypothetical protein